MLRVDGGLNEAHIDYLEGGRARGEPERLDLVGPLPADSIAQGAAGLAWQLEVGEG